MALNDTLEKRDGLMHDMQAILDAAETEKRDLSADEKAKFDKMDGEMKTLEERRAREERMRELDRRSEEAEHIAGERRDQPEMNGYSAAKAIMEGAEMRMTGLEAEWHQHLSEQRGPGRKPQGVMIPTAHFGLGVEQRAVLTSGSGGNMKATDLAAMTDRRRPALRVQQLGATVLGNLTGDMDLPRLAGSGTAHWVGEHVDTSTSDASFEKKTASPKTVSGEYELSRRMILQSQQAIDPILQRDLAFILSQALDSAAILGGGVDEPVGILSDAAITATASAGGDIGEDTSLLMQELEIDDVFDEAAFLTNPRLAHEARVSRDTTGQPLPTGWMWHGRPFALTNQVQQSAANTYPVIYGAFSNLYLSFWSGVDILMNPYSDRVSSKGGMLLQAFLDTDVTVRHPEAFAYTHRTL